MNFSEYAEHVSLLKEQGRYRQFKPLSKRQGCRIEYNERQLLNLTSNDYLGLAGNVKLHEEFYKELDSDNMLERYGLGVASSRLLTGDTITSHLLEQDIQRAYVKESCLLFNSGYHANIGILPALTSKKDLILSDKLNHASITDGLRLSAAEYKRYRHCDYEHLDYLLTKHRHGYDKVIIASESVFSMDGDVIDLPQLVALKKKHNCWLYIDEAHSVAVYGEKGLGIAEQQQQLGDVDLLVGTFGKAFGSVGAFLLCESVVREFLINKSRSLIFTTALPPVVLSWNRFIFNRLELLGEQRVHLKNISDKFRSALQKKNLKTDGSTNIVPVLIGDDTATVELAEEMQKRGFLIFPVRPPTVPAGTSRFRLSLTADMAWKELEVVPDLIAELIEKRR